jgi:Ca2+-binding EF-hand superfamily protein
MLPNMFSEEQLEDFREAFNLFDDAKETGKITKDSFCTLIRAIGFCPSQKELDDLLQTIRQLQPQAQQPSSLMITFDTFIMAVAQKISKSSNNTHELIDTSSTVSEETPSQDAELAPRVIQKNPSIFSISAEEKIILEQQLIEAFRVFDPQHTGCVSSKELYSLLTSLGEKLSDKEASNLLTEADPTNSGKIEYISFVKLLLSY